MGYLRTSILLLLFFSACGDCGENNGNVDPASATNEDVVGFWWTHTQIKQTPQDWAFNTFSFQEHSEETGLDWSFMLGDEANGQIGTYEVQSAEIRVSISGHTLKGYNIKELQADKMIVDGFLTGESTLLRSERCNAPGDFASFGTPGLIESVQGSEPGPVAWTPDGELHAGGLGHFRTHKKWCGLKPSSAFPRAMELVFNQKGEGYALDWTDTGSIEIYEFDASKPDVLGQKKVAGSMGRALNLQDEMTVVLRPDGRPVFISTAGQMMFERKLDQSWETWAGVPLGGVVSQGVRATMHPDGRLVLMRPNLSLLPFIESAPGSHLMIPYDEIPNPRAGHSGDNLNIMYAFDDDATLYAVYSQWFEVERPDQLFEFSYADALFLAKWNGNQWERESLGIGNPYEFEIQKGVAKIASVTFRKAGLSAFFNVDLKTKKVEIQTTGEVGLIELGAKYSSMVQSANVNAYPRAVFGSNNEIANVGASWTFNNEGAPRFKVPVEFINEDGLEFEMEIAGQTCSENCEIDLAFNAIYRMLLSSDTDLKVDVDANSVYGRTNVPNTPLAFEPNRGEFWLVSSSPWNMKIRITIKPNYLVDPVLLHDIEVDGIVQASVLNAKGEQIVFYKQSIDGPCGGVSSLAVRLDKSRKIVTRECFAGISIEELLKTDQGLLIRTLIPEPGWVLIDEDTLKIKTTGWKFDTPQNAIYGSTIKDGKLTLIKVGLDRIPKLVFFDIDGGQERTLDLDLGVPWFASGTAITSLSFIGDKYLFHNAEGKTFALNDDGTVAWQLPVLVHDLKVSNGILHAVGFRGTVGGQDFSSTWYARFNSEGELTKVVGYESGNVIGALTVLDDDRLLVIASKTAGTLITVINQEEEILSVGWSSKIGGGLNGLPDFKFPVIAMLDGDVVRLAFTNAVGAINGTFVDFGGIRLPGRAWPSAWAGTLKLP